MHDLIMAHQLEEQSFISDMISERTVVVQIDLHSGANTFCQSCCEDYRTSMRRAKLDEVAEKSPQQQ